MEHRIIGKTGISASILGFGGIVVQDTSAEEARAIVSEAVDVGINYFDVAPSYGNAQEILGPALAPHRNNIYLTCKTGKRDKKGALAELHESLRALKTDYFDVYQLHALTAPEEIDQALAPGGALEALQEAKAEGLIRFIGFSSHADEAALRIMKYFPFDTILYPVNWALQLQKDMAKEVLMEAEARNMGRIALKALAYGPKTPLEDGYPKAWYRPILDNERLADIALRYTLSQNVHVAISPGDARLLRLGIAILQKHHGKPSPIQPDELQYLKEQSAQMKTFMFYDPKPTV